TEVLVHAAQLAEVGEFVGTSHVADRRENRVLHNRKEQDVRAEAGGLRRRLLHERRGGVLLIANHETAVLLANRAAAPLEREQRQAVVLRVHLRVVAARGQIRSGEGGELYRVSRIGQLAGKPLADDRLRGGIRRVVDDESAVADNL